MNTMTAEMARCRMDDIAREVAAAQAARACRQAAVPGAIASQRRRWRGIFLAFTGISTAGRGWDVGVSSIGVAARERQS